MKLSPTAVKLSPIGGNLSQLQGNFSHLQGTFPRLQGTFSRLQWNFPQLQGTFGANIGSTPIYKVLRIKNIWSIPIGGCSEHFLFDVLHATCLIRFFLVSLLSMRTIKKQQTSQDLLWIKHTCCHDVSYFTSPCKWIIYPVPASWLMLHVVPYGSVWWLLQYNGSDFPAHHYGLCYHKSKDVWELEDQGFLGSFNVSFACFISCYIFSTQAVYKHA